MRKIKRFGNFVILRNDLSPQKGKIVSKDINYALILDRMYKGTLKDGDLDKFTAEQIDMMKKEIEEKREYLSELYNVGNKINI